MQEDFSYKTSKQYNDFNRSHVRGKLDCVHAESILLVTPPPAPRIARSEVHSSHLVDSGFRVPSVIVPVQTYTLFRNTPFSSLIIPLFILPSNKSPLLETIVVLVPSFATVLYTMSSTPSFALYVLVDSHATQFLLGNISVTPSVSLNVEASANALHIALPA